MVATAVLKSSDGSARMFKQIIKDPYSQYYPSNWPDMPFHPGELELQEAAEVHESVMSYAPRVVRPYLPDQHRIFYQNQPFLVAAARDKFGNMWSTLLTSPTGQSDLITSPNPTTLTIHGGVVAGDALEGDLSLDCDLGLLGIELATKRRNRVNGRITAVTEDGALTFTTDQSFGNCPQYIKPRNWWTAVAGSKNSGKGSMKTYIKRSTELSSDQVQAVKRAETVFIATGFRGEGDDVRYGNDSSHRGGPEGFLMVQDFKTIVLPDFAGNNHFNSLGNILLDNRMGITIPSFEDGGMLQLSGTATVDTNVERASKTYPGALRLITFQIDQVNEVPPDSHPIRWSSQDEKRALRVVDIAQESGDVKSFHLQDPSKPLWNFVAGQHLPIRLRTPTGELLRTYSLSGSPLKKDSYRISVKRQGKASNYLHEKVTVGDIIHVNRPAGDFELENDGAYYRTLVLLSSGIGVTPILSMLHQFVAGNQGYSKAVWIHGARDGDNHPFKDEVKVLLTPNVSSHVVYSKPLETDHCYDSVGRIDVNLVKAVVGDMQSAEYYICGSGGFLADMEVGLMEAGVNEKHVHFETF